MAGKLMDHSTYQGKMIDVRGFQRFLFLDFDGVTNSEIYRAEMQFPKVLTGRQLFDPEALIHLNRIVRETQCGIVISSSWRRIYSLGYIAQIMRSQGFEHHYSFVGMTNSHGQHLPHGRWNEIQEWMWFAKRQGANVASYVVLDDFPLTDAPDTHLIRTDHRVGLTEEDADRVIAAFQAQEAMYRK